MGTIGFRTALLRQSCATSLPALTASFAPRACFVHKWLQSRNITLSPQCTQEPVPRRKCLKDEAKRNKARLRASTAPKKDAKQHEEIPLLEKWELTVGIEIHAELNTHCKLFSSALTESHDGTANGRVALFDAAMPGTQPQFQTATLLPALRAAIALQCSVQRTSRWDRKHYFHWDQPNGYQITQYYRPFATDGCLRLSENDGVPASDLDGAELLTIGIKQIQMEQDTAKTISHSRCYHIDLNRAGHPLIEIITLPQIHSPQTAVAVVRKIQAMLKSVDACVTGMELGGLRADVNVSVRRRGTDGTGASYSGVTGLGQRTEIKNLSTFKSIEDAIVAERDRQIDILEQGGVIEGETRGWTLGSTQTTRLRGKEGEVDYRYMPDADLAPLVIGADLVEHLRTTLPELPDETEGRLVRLYGLSMKDAKTIVGLNDGERLEFMYETVDLVETGLGDVKYRKTEVGRTVGNWVLHELGGLLTITETRWQDSSLQPSELADIIVNLLTQQITNRVAKQLLATLISTTPSDSRLSVEQLLDQGNLRLRPLSEAAYVELAEQVLDKNKDIVERFRKSPKSSILMYFVGQMIRQGEEGTVVPEAAKNVLETMLANECGSD